MGRWVNIYNKHFHLYIDMYIDRTPDQNLLSPMSFSLFSPSPAGLAMVLSSVSVVLSSLSIRF